MEFVPLEGLRTGKLISSDERLGTRAKLISADTKEKKLPKASPLFQDDSLGIIQEFFPLTTELKAKLTRTKKKEN